jgi:hypothetical protein
MVGISLGFAFMIGVTLWICKSQSLFCFGDTANLDIEAGRVSMRSAKSDDMEPMVIGGAK